MTFQQALTVFSTILILSGCHKKQTDLEFEQNVLYEIIPEIIDSLNVDLILRPVPPPGKPIFDENDSLIGIDTVGVGKAYAEYERKKKELVVSNPRLIIYVFDTVNLLEQRDKSALIHYLQEKNLELDSTDISDNYKIEIDKIQFKKNVELRYRSELPDGISLWDKKFDINMAGTTSFSRIQFDKTKTYGVLNASYGCGSLCGWGTRIFIRKVNGKWTILKVVETSVS